MRVSCLRISRKESRAGKFSGRIPKNGGMDRSRLTSASVIFGSNAASQRCGRSKVGGAVGMSVNAHASSTRLDLGLQMQVRHEPPSALAPCSARYSTSPDLIATRHVPQLPARQPASILMPCSSANSSREAVAGFQWQVLPERLNVTSNLESIAVWLSVGDAVAFFTVAGPNASKWTFWAGTPQAAR